MKEEKTSNIPRNNGVRNSQNINNEKTIRINIRKSIEIANEDRKRQLVNKDESIEERILADLKNSH